MNAADVLVKRLEEHGVTTVFALPGEENLAVVEAIAESTISLVVVRHEQHGAFMAATHGRLTGRPGVCLATLGPGALNLFTGLAHAELGGMPVIALTGQKAQQNNEEGSFQVVDIVAAARPVTRWATSIADHKNVAATIDEAFNRALSGRPGAVLVELPEDIAGIETEPAHLPVPIRTLSVPSDHALASAVEMIDAADRPVLLVGEGTNNPLTAEAVRVFAEATGSGVLATQLGKGAIAESHPLSMRSLGIHRPDYAHLAIEPADLVIAVGYQPVEHPPLAWNPQADTPIMHIAAWPAAIERGYQPELQLTGDPALTLRGLADRVQPRDPAPTIAVGDVIKRLLSEEDAGSGYPVSPLAVVRSVQDALGPTDTVALDNGAYKIWFARHYRCEAVDTLLLDNALATMGAGLATAMEAARIDPARRAIAVCGDGGFLMNVQDVETACRLGLNLTILVVRDNSYGFIEWHQKEESRPADGVHLTNPDLVALAMAFGASGHRINEGDDLTTTIRNALDEPGVSLIDCPITYDINDLLETDLYQKAKDAAQ